MDHGFEALVGFVVSRGDAAEFLELAEEILDQMPPLVPLDIVGNADGSVGFGRDHRHGAPVGQLGAEPVTVEGFIGEQGGKVELGQQGGDTHAVVALSRQENEAHEIAQRIDQSDDLGRQPAAGTPNGLILCPPACAGPVLVHPDDGSIDDHGLEIGILRQGFKNLIEDAASDPSATRRAARQNL